MDSMDYHMDNMSAPRFVPPFPNRRCPYVHQAGSSSRNFYIPPPSTFVSAGTYPLQQPPAWPDYPFLPPPIPNQHAMLTNTFDRPHLTSNFTSFAQAQRQQTLRQQINMADSLETQSNSSGSWQSTSFEGGATQAQSEAGETWRSRGVPGSNAGMAGLNGSYNNVGSHDRSTGPNSRILPPLQSAFDQSIQAGSSSRDADGTPRTNAPSESTTERRPQQTPSRYEYTSGEASQSRRFRALQDITSRMAPSTRSSDATSALLTPRERFSASHISSAVAAEELDELLSYFSANTNEHMSSIENLLDRVAPLTHNEGPASIEEVNYRTAFLQRILSEVRRPSKKAGASKTALESLVKIAITDLEEDDRTCKICYNDYGVANPEGETEYPLQLPKCKHAFGENCLKKWLEEKTTCPYCRDQLPAEQRSQRLRRAFENQRTHGEPRSRHTAHALARPSLRHVLHTGRHSTESTEQGSARSDRQQTIVERINQVTQVEERLAAQVTERNSDTPSAGRGSQASLISPHATLYASQNSPTSRRARGRANNSRESGQGGESHQSYPTSTLQPSLTTSTQQMLMNNSYSLREESGTGFYMTPTASAIVGTNNGSARLSTASSYAQVESSSNPLFDNQLGGFPRGYSYYPPVRADNAISWRDTARQNYRPPGDLSLNHGPSWSSTPYTGRSIYTGQDDFTQTSRNFPPGSSLWREPMLQAAVERTRTDHSNNQTMVSPEAMSNIHATWQQSNGNEIQYIPQHGQDSHRDPPTPASLSASSPQNGQEQAPLNFETRPPGAYFQERLPDSISLPQAHINAGAEYQNSRSENAAAGTEPVDNVYNNGAYY